MLIGGAALIAAPVVAIALALTLGHSSSHPASSVPLVGSMSGGLPEAAAVNTLFAGVPQHGTTLGAKSAPVTIVEYIDLQCPFCQQFETRTFPDIVRRFVRTAKVKVVMQPWAFIGPDSVRGQSAVLAAAGQNKAFNFAELLYDNQGTENTGWLNDRMVTAASSIPGLLVHELLSDQSTNAVKVQAQHVDKLAQTNNVRETPDDLRRQERRAGTHPPPSITDRRPDAHPRDRGGAPLITTSVSS